MSKIKLYGIGGIILLFIGMIISIKVLYSKLQTTETNYSNSTSVVKAYENKLSKNDSIQNVFKLTIDQLNTSQDSLMQKIKVVQKSSKIKDKDLQQVQYSSKTVSKLDSISFKHDTIFTTKVNIDTVIGDKWLNIKLQLKYPSLIKTTSTINLESYLFVYSKRETIAPRKKFFLLRWFQKKQTILNIKVVEKNPYVKNKEQEFIQLIKNK